MSLRQNIAKSQPKEPALLVAVVSVLVIVHFLFMLAVPIAFIYEVKFLQSEDAFHVWLCQPLVIAAFLTVINRRWQTCRVLVYIDLGISLLQIISILLLHAFADKIG